MSVKLDKFGTLHIWHKNGIGRVSDILAIGNQYRSRAGANPIVELTSYLRKPSTWRTIIAIHNKMVEHQEENPNCSANSLQKLDIKETMANLPLYRSSKANCSRDSLGNTGEMSNCATHSLGKDGDLIDYAKILKSKQFKHIIKSQRGGKVENRGYWANLHLLLDIAMMMNEEFKVELIDIFITRKLLEHRDKGGNAFKALNILIDTFPDLIEDARYNRVKISKSNVPIYKEMASIINEKVNGEFSLGWNDEEKKAKQQEQREIYLKKLVSFIEMGFVNSYDSLKNTIERL
jgi:predicted nucleic acid-binding protein